MFFDFIVIGSGVAGLTSALVLKNFGRVLLVTKGKIEEGATALAQGGIAAVLDKKDSFQNHFRDTLKAGAYHNKKKAVEILVKEAPKAISWLVKQGVRFEKKNSHFSLTKEGAHSFPRILYFADSTGREIERALGKKVKESKNILIWEEAFAERLLVEKRVCYGVKVWKKSGEIKFCFSSLVVLATGGLGQLYLWTTNPKTATGDGLALAYRAGAKLRDLEFIQFHPTAFKEKASPLFLLSEALRGEGAQLKRVKKGSTPQEGERFMFCYDKRGELASRDIVSRAIFFEEKKGYRVFLDIRGKKEEFLKKRFPGIYQTLKEKGYDLAKDLIPVTPAAHYSCGGVETDLLGRTNIKNLLAFGEVAWTGVHGANRLASNSLLEGVVFPLRLFHLKESFSSLISFPKEKIKGLSAKKEKERPVKGKDQERIKKIKKSLQKLMWEKAGVVRRGKDLREGLVKVENWQKIVCQIKGESQKKKELENMLLVASLIFRAALKRKKSLGAHFRLD